MKTKQEITYKDLPGSGYYWVKLKFPENSKWEVCYCMHDGVYRTGNRSIYDYSDILEIIEIENHPKA